MQDPITELPPPSRFQVGDLNNFVSPYKSLSLPRPFVAWARTLDSPPRLLLIALSKAACHLVHYLHSKTLMGTFVLPEISMSENTIEPSVQDKSCLLYSPKGDPTVMLASVQYAVSEERAVVWAKALLREVRPEAVVVASSIPSMHFRGVTTRDVLDQPILAELANLVGLNVVPFQIVVLGLAVHNFIDLAPPKLASPREIVLLGDTSSLVCHVDSYISSRGWQKDAAKLEDGWASVKGKKSKSAIPPLDMNLLSYKGGFKSKSKS